MRFFKDKRKRASGIWHVKFRTKTGWRSLSTGETDLEKAKLVAKGANIEGIEMARKINLVASAAAMYALIGRTVTSEQAFNEWCVNLHTRRHAQTCERYASIVRPFLKKCGWPERLAAITPSAIDEWVNTRDVTLRLSTRRVQRAALLSFFKFCEGEGWCSNPVANVVVKYGQLTHDEKEQKHRRPFTQDEFERLVAVAAKEPEPYWYAAVMIARYAGLRWGDVNELESASILSDRLVVWTRKRDRRVELPMPPELPPVFDMLAKHPLNQEAVMADRPGKVFQEFPVKVRAESGAEFRRLLNEAGLPADGTLTPHCLRHTYAVELAKSGLGLREIARRMGHFGEATTLGYLRSLLLP